MEDLLHSTVNTIDGDVVCTPSSDIVMSGLVCKTRSILQGKRASYRNSYATAWGESAESFRMSIDIIKTQKRLLVVINETVACAD